MNVPQLRFKGFSDDWQQNTLEQLAEVSTGDKDTKDRVDDGQYPFFVRSQTVEKIDSYSFEGEAILTSGDGVGVGKNFHYINGRFDYHQRVYCIYNFKADVFGRYIYFYFSEKFNRRVMALSAKNSVDSVRRSMITEMPISAPSYLEQTKIANFLSAVDEKITQLTQKHELLNQYKKGVMQKIFSQELRFKDDDGREFREWGSSKLYNLVDKIGSGGTPKSSVAEYYDGDIPWVSISDMTSSGKFITNTARKISSLGLKNSSAKLYPEGTLLFAMYASIGEVSIAKLSVTSSQAILGIIPKKHLLMTEYLYFWLLSLKEKIALLGQQGAQANLNLEMVKNFEIKLPSLNEQTKIANFLTVIDDKITATQSQLVLVKQYKQGLLQQMFI